jgi:hypothetical protein
MAEEYAGSLDGKYADNDGMFNIHALQDLNRTGQSQLCGVYKVLNIKEYYFLEITFTNSAMEPKG